MQKSPKKNVNTAEHSQLDKWQTKSYTQYYFMLKGEGLEVEEQEGTSILTLLFSTGLEVPAAADRKGKSAAHGRECEH